MVEIYLSERLSVSKPHHPSDWQPNYPHDLYHRKYMSHFYSQVTERKLKISIFHEYKTLHCA